MTTTQMPLAPASETEMKAGLPAEEVRCRLARASRREETGQRVLAFYLVEMDGRRLYQASGHGGTEQYAELRLGIDRRRTAELLRVGRKLLELAEVDRAFCAGRIGWAKVLVLARVASPPHEAAWLERALALDCRSLAALARRSKEGGPPRKPGDSKGLPEIRFPVAASLGVLAHAKLERAQARLADELGRPVVVADLLEALADDFLASEADGSTPGRRRVDASLYRVIVEEERAAGGNVGGPGGSLLVETPDGPLPIETPEAVRCDAEALHVAGEAHVELDVKTPPALRRKVLSRDGGRCRSCLSRHGLMVHHLEFRSEGGRTSPENLITLCTRCHGLVHEGLLRMEGSSAGEARFVDGVGRALEGVEPGEVLEAPERQAVEEAPVVTLAQVPEVVDAGWWRRHAHLFRDRGDSAGLRFEAGVAEGWVEAPGTVPTAAESEAFAGVVGQDERVQRLRTVARGAAARGKPFPHTLFSGPAGTGKTRLARGIATCLGRRTLEVSAPLVTERTTWLRLLASVEEGGVLFLDEAHALPRPLLEMLLEAMAEARLTLTVSDGVEARPVTLALARFTLVAATTEEGALSAALRSRFGLREPLVHYDTEALAKLLREAAAAQRAPTTDEAAQRLAQAARGTPREALRLLDRALDTCAAEGGRCLDGAAAERALTCLGYDQDGLDATEQRYVEVLRQSRVPVPLSRLSRILGASPSTLLEHVEPHLFERGLVRMTIAGRTASPYLA